MEAMPIALTVDDAPSVFAPGSPDFDPGRMDRVRTALQETGVRHCVAFVIGERARDHREPLRRWLEAGYELGNHTEAHLAASRVGADAYLEGVRGCHALLNELGAFDGGRRAYFRHPFGDRGAAGGAREAIDRAIAQLGYTHADVTLNLHDYCYEAPFIAAARTADAARQTRIRARYRRVADACVARAGKRGTAHWGARFVHVAACHFGPLSEHELGGLVRDLGSRVAFRSLAEATETPAYRRLAADLSHNGIAGDLLHRRLRDRALRKLARSTRRLGLFQQSRLGPCWPHLAP